MGLDGDVQNQRIARLEETFDDLEGLFQSTNSVILLLMCQNVGLPSEEVSVLVVAVGICDFTHSNKR